ncbi:MAG: SpoIIE family protein phosphatase, partial [Pirellulales bacterium]
MEDCSLSLSALLIEDNPGDARLIRELLSQVREVRFELEHVDRLAAGLDRLARGPVALVLLDLSLPESRGLETFRQMRSAAGTTPIVVLTGLDDAELAVAAVQEGAEDYLAKGQVTSQSLARSMRYAVERGRRRAAEDLVRAAEEEFRVARQIQQRFFPTAAPELEGFDIAGSAYCAVATGGDYFDYIPMLDDCLGIAIGDVSGHGFGAALLMAETRAYLRALALTRADVGELVTLVNRVLVNDTPDDQFVTLLLARLDPRARTLVYTSAGHLAGYLLDRSGRPKILLDSTSYPLGIDGCGEFTAAGPFRLESGDMIALMTDGLIEAHAGSRRAFGVERALECIASHR